MSKKDKVTEVLNKLDSKSKMSTGTKLNIDKVEYGELIDVMLDEALISNSFYKLVRGHMS